MRKLMEGRAPGRPGVAAKMGALVETIREGGWCEEQGSLMRGAGLRHARPRRGALPARARCTAASVRPAEPTCSRCAASRSVLPPAAASARRWCRGRLPRPARAAVRVGSARARPRRGAPAAAPGAGRQRRERRHAVGDRERPARAARPAAPEVAGLLVGGPLGAKLAVGCLLALGVGAGCAVLSAGGSRGAHSSGAHARSSASVRPVVPDVPGAAGALAASPRALASVRANAAAGGQRVARGEVGRASERRTRVRAGAGRRRRCVGGRSAGRDVGRVVAPRLRGAPLAPASAASAPSSSAQRVGGRTRVLAVRRAAWGAVSSAGRPCSRRANASGLPRGRSLPGGEGAERVQPLADDVDPVLVGEAQAQVGRGASPSATELEPFSTVRCQVGMSGSVNSHWKVVALAQAVSRG